ncbi:MAG: diguanylate cyclase [Candidatus Delongbacteria bacterium]|nr:diguanylate cyclase [Candidatus Delongbacteria bacterium]
MRWMLFAVAMVLGVMVFNRIEAQNPGFDSIVTDDTATLADLNRQVDNLRDSLPEKSLDYALAAVELARKLALIPEQKKALLNLSEVYIRLKQPEKAAQIMEECLALEGILWDETDRIDLMNRTAYQYLLSSSHEKAVHFSLKALEESEAGNHYDQMSVALQHQGYLSRLRGNLKQSETFYQRIVDLQDKIENQSAVGNALNELGNLRILENDYPGALDYKKQALKTAVRLKDKGLEAYCSNDLGIIYQNMEDYTQALNYYKRASRLLKNPSREYALSLMNIAGLYYYLGNRSMSLGYYREAETICRNLGLKTELKDVLQTKAESWFQAGQYDSAYLALYEAYQTYREVFSETSTEKIAQMQARYESEKKEREIELLKKNEAIQQLRYRKQQMMRNFLLVSLILSLAVVFLIWKGYRLKVRTNRELEAAKNKLDELSRHDPLTGLSNRRDFLEKLTDEMNRYDRYGQPFCLILSDIDHFKEFNDRYGHDGGDYVLRMASLTIRNQIRKQDSLARWGGEEFLILLPETEMDHAIMMAQRIQSELSRAEFVYRDLPLRITMTFGVAEAISGLKMEELVNRADQAMYYGKTNGRHCVCISDAGGYFHKIDPID